MSYSRPLWLLVALCAACGADFQASAGGGGASGLAGGGAGSAGGASSAGAANGGVANGGAGKGGAPGRAGAGGHASAGDAGAGEAGMGTNGGASHAGAGGSSTGGSPSAGAGGAGPDECTKLRQEYGVLLEKARVCSKEATGECSASSTLPPVGCGCAVLVNAKSEYTPLAKKKQQELQDKKCLEMLVCPLAVCAPYQGATCSQAMGAGQSFVCTAVFAGGSD